MIDISRQLIRWRYTKGVSQRELSLKAGIARANLINIEYGRSDITLKTLENLAKALDLNPFQLLGAKDDLGIPDFDNFSRHDWEKAAKYLLGDEIDFAENEKMILDKIRPLFRPLLEAQGIFVCKKDREDSHYPYYFLKKIVGKKVLNTLHERLLKLIPLYQVSR